MALWIIDTSLGVLCAIVGGVFFCLWLVFLAVSRSQYSVQKSCGRADGTVRSALFCCDVATCAHRRIKLCLPGTEATQEKFFSWPLSRSRAGALSSSVPFFLRGLLVEELWHFHDEISTSEFGKGFFKLCLSLWNILGYPGWKLECCWLLSPCLACWMMVPCFSPGISGNVFILGYALAWCKHFSVWTMWLPTTV